MAGVAVRLPPGLGGSDLGGLAERYRNLARTLEPKIAEIARIEMGHALTGVRAVSPYKTGRFYRGLKVAEYAGLRFSLQSDPIDPKTGKHYASFIHKRGESGQLFWVKYMVPEVMEAHGRIRVRVQDLIRAELVSGGALTKLAPTLAASRSLAARGRMR